MSHTKADLELVVRAETETEDFRLGDGELAAKRGNTMKDKLSGAMNHGEGIPCHRHETQMNSTS
jgi:hypothetical protein